MGGKGDDFCQEEKQNSPVGVIISKPFFRLNIPNFKCPTIYAFVVIAEQLVTFLTTLLDYFEVCFKGLYGMKNNPSILVVINGGKIRFWELGERPEIARMQRNQWERLGKVAYSKSEHTYDVSEV